MQHAELLAPAAEKLNEYATYLLGPSGITRGKPIEKHFVPQICMAASSMGLTGSPQMIFPVWMAHLSAPAGAGPVQEKKPVDAVIAFWNESTETLLACEAGRSTETIGLHESNFIAAPVEFHKGKGFMKTVVPGLALTNGTTHFAIGLRNALSVGASFTDRAKPCFAQLAARLQG